MAIFDDVFADVGDEQSIQASLSTFSAHLKNLAEVLSSATARSLVLIDELGSGTDPIEGAALGGAILEALTARGTLSIATTHLGALKELATQVDGVVNASLQFDPVALAPTYRLTKGIPGRSYGISIARRLNLPAEVLKRAEERIPAGRARVTALLAELEAREKALGATSARRARLPTTRRNARGESRSGRRTSRSASARRSEPHDRKRGSIFSRPAPKSSARSTSSRRHRSRAMTRLAKRGNASKVSPTSRDASSSGSGTKTGPLETAGNPTDVNVGDFVEVETLGGKVGRVVEVRDEEAVVAVGVMKLTVPREHVATLRRREARPPKSPLRSVATCPRCTRRARSTSAGCASAKSKTSLCRRSMRGSRRSQDPANHPRKRNRARCASASPRCCARNRASRAFGSVRGTKAAPA